MPNDRPSLIRAWLPVLLAVVLAGCATDTTPSPSPVAIASPSQGATAGPAASGQPSASPTARPTPKPTAAPTPRPSTSAASCVDRTYAAMSLAQRIGQLFMVGLAKDTLDATTRAAIAQYHFGSVVFTTQTGVGVTAIRHLTDAIQALATKSTTDRARFLVAANQEGGKIQGLSGPGFDTIPSALMQGSLSTSTLTTRAERWGRELIQAGVNVNLAPVADVVPPGTDAQNAPIGQLQREYAHDPATAASHVAAFIKGMAAAGVETTAKHFPGLGRVEGNTDFTGDVVDNVTTRTDPYLAPFQRAVDVGVPFVMVSLATYEQIDPDRIAAFSPTVIGGMLRHDLGFRGVVVSDALGATAVGSIPPGTRALDFIATGGDLVIINQVAQADQMAQAVLARAQADATFRAQADTAVRRVLAAKSTAGLLPCGG
jgi:beta-N-acetylhexosaminidase